MSRLSRLLNKPEYFFSPPQLLKRVRELVQPTRVSCPVKLPWNSTIVVNPQETVGRSILHFGVYDLALTETLWRLTDPGMKALDIGANIGYFSTLLARKAATVQSFEPHPEIFKRLRKNLAGFSNSELHQLGLSSSPGEMKLFIPKDFAGNEGTASLESTEGEAIAVRVDTLDGVLAGKTADIIKIDVEGHELSVFQGGQQTLKNVKHVLFEDFKGAQSPVVKLLREMGFSVFRLRKSFFGPQLAAVENTGGEVLREPPNYLATREPELAAGRLASKGWRALQALQ